MESIQEKTKGNVRIKLSLFWTALMFCYVYADILGFYAPGNLSELLTVGIAGIQITGGWLFASAALMIVPILMIPLSVTLKPRLNRIVNIVIGVVQFGILVTTFFTGRNPAYYIFFASVKAVLIILIIVQAWRWRHGEK